MVHKKPIKIYFGETGKTDAVNRAIKDMAGQTRPTPDFDYEFFTPTDCIRGGKIMYVADINRAESIEELIKKWTDSILKETKPDSDTPILVYFDGLRGPIDPNKKYTLNPKLEEDNNNKERKIKK